MSHRRFAPFATLSLWSRASVRGARALGGALVALALAATAGLAWPGLSAGCSGTGCGPGYRAVFGACYPEDEVAQADGGVPIQCAHDCLAIDGGGEVCHHGLGLCVECVRDADCGDPDRAHCDSETFRCTPCLGDSDCAHVEGRPYCLETMSGPPRAAQCVACTSANEELVCGRYSCDALEHRCTPTLRGSATACEPCRASSECGASQDCVEFDWLGTGVERVCLWDTADVSCATDGASAYAPYGREATMRSVEGSDVHVCEPASACAAVLDYVAHKPCSTRSECGGPALASTCLAGSCRIGCFGYPYWSAYHGCLAPDECLPSTWCGPVVP